MNPHLYFSFIFFLAQYMGTSSSVSTKYAMFNESTPNLKLSKIQIKVEAITMCKISDFCFHFKGFSICRNVYSVENIPLVIIENMLE